MNNIQQFLSDKGKRIGRMDRLPIITYWLDALTMRESIAIIDKHVEYFLNHGGSKKVEEWLLADDERFNAITAERYIMSYLRQLNENLSDNLCPNGIDAHLDYDGSRVGIEITTLNDFIDDWIFVERLKQLLVESNLLTDKGLEISDTHQRLSNEKNGKRIYDYIEQVGRFVKANDVDALSGLEISLKWIDGFPGCISWNLSDGNGIPWYECITDKLYSKLKSVQKSRQLAKYSRNIVFVGINHLSASDGIFPSFFKYIEKSEEVQYPEIKSIQDFWVCRISELKNVIGICYFFYSLEQETPFYPLKIFWRGVEDMVNINI
jgi:hypothetical protein